MENLPESISRAVRHLSSAPRVSIEAAPEYVSAESAWALRLHLTSERTSTFVPEQTKWVLLVDNSYPSGAIRLYPDRKGGLIHTFPHQDRNILPREDSGWRTGKPCLDSPSLRLGRVAGGPEPKHDAEARMRWHVERCLSWLEAAATKQLMADDEPFEIPQVPSELLTGDPRVIHDEGANDLPAWNSYVRKFGKIRLGVLPGFEKTVLAEEFLDDQGKRIRVCGRGLSETKKKWFGFWWLWPSPVILPPWHAPGTWGDLRLIGERLDVNVEQFVRWFAGQAKGKKTAIILIGYPIPSHWNGSSSEIHWQAVVPPTVPKKIKPPNGFRPNRLGRHQRLRRSIFGDGKHLRYLVTSNWHPDRLQARGRFADTLRRCSIAIIGAGALGSAVAELLARGGIRELMVIDHDALEVGNLVRHTLTGKQLLKNKAVGVAERLQAVAPMANISSFDRQLPAGAPLNELLQPYDIILDCTGEDEVLLHLASAWWNIPKLFLSASLGFAATRLFLFEARACSFPLSDFRDAIHPWLEHEREQWTAAGETLEGAGCWSPLFPARIDDVWLAAIACVRHLERTASGDNQSGLRTLEQGEGHTVGYRVVAGDES